MKLNPQIHGGGHEGKIRSGTLAVHNIVGLGKACEISKNVLEIEYKTIKKMRDYLLKGLIKKIPEIIINGSMIHRLPGNLYNLLP